MRPPVVFLCLCTAALAAQDPLPVSFDLPDFNSPQDLNLVGDARSHGPAVRLTEAVTRSVGGIWYAAKEPVTRGFETTFRFQLTDPGGLGNGADGIAFVMQNSGAKALAGRGSSGGWGLGDGERNKHSPGIARAIAVFFDTFKNDEDHDPSDNYIEICNNGGPKQMKWPPHRMAFTPRLGVFLKDGRVHTAKIRYKPPVISVFLDDDTHPVLVSAVDVSLVADAKGSAWVGFTASTGAGFENHDLLSWSFNTTDVSSAMVSSNISFFMDKCAPGHNLCTPDRAIVEETAPGRYHVVLPANVEWGASVPNRSGREVVVNEARGTVCWDLAARGPEGCSGPDGSSSLNGGVAKEKPSGSLVMKTRGGRTYFSVNDRNFTDNEGYFEFEVEVR
ncbi:MAG TPA: L-type lectin-domain containing protein [Bryobacteraceae bacterium]